jgi:hypothetical protein
LPARASGAPHVPQNWKPSGLAAAQRVQIVTITSVATVTELDGPRRAPERGRGQLIPRELADRLGIVERARLEGA